MEDLNELKVIGVEEVGSVCVFCKYSTVNEIEFGKLYIRNGVVIHYFCMLFSSALCQRGKDKEGILGFLVDDIMKEMRRGLRLKCSFCNEIGATIGCCCRKCKLNFHYPCGRANNIHYQFTGKFETHCKEHFTYKKPKIPPKFRNSSCPICINPVVVFNIDILMPTCCKNAIFHRDCIQKLALSAGYFFKCPTCNCTTDFIKEMRIYGVYVPEQDASWECEPQAFQDLYVQYENCDEANCKCPNGRSYVSDKGRWMIARCKDCGSAGSHKCCGKISDVEKWTCKDCQEFSIKAEKARAEKENLPSTSSASNTANNRLIPDDAIDLTKIKISKSCFNFFPYNKQVLKKYKNANSLPDWRQLELRVNVIDWLKDLKITTKPVYVNENPNNETFQEAPQEYYDEDSDSSSEESDLESNEEENNNEQNGKESSNNNNETRATDSEDINSLEGEFVLKLKINGPASQTKEQDKVKASDNEDEIMDQEKEAQFSLPIFSESLLMDSISETITSSSSQPSLGSHEQDCYEIDNSDITMTER